MDYAYSILAARRRLDDACTLYQFCSRTAVNEYEEAAWHWNDQRGGTFVRAFLHPQTELIVEGQVELASQTLAGETCFNEAAHCEREQAIGMAERADSETCSGRADQLTRRANDLAGRVVAGCSQIRSALDGIMVGVMNAEFDPGWD